MNQVEIFKTNVEEEQDAQTLVSLLHQHLPAHRINFDLQDCDKILRVEGNGITIQQIIVLVKDKGFECRLLH